MYFSLYSVHDYLAWIIHDLVNMSFEIVIQAVLNSKDQIHTGSNNTIELIKVCCMNRFLNCFDPF